MKTRVKQINFIVIVAITIAFLCLAMMTSCSSKNPDNCPAISECE